MAELTRQEFRAAIFYDYRRGLSVDECCRSLKQCFGELRAPSRTTIFNRYRDFKNGLISIDKAKDAGTRMDIHLVCEFVERVREFIKIDPSISCLEIAKKLGLDLGLVETIVKDALKLGQLNEQWTPVTLTDSQRSLRTDWASFMLDKFGDENGSNTNRIIACFDAWIYKCRTVKKSSRVTTEYWTFEKCSRIVDKRMVICFYSKSGVSVIASVDNIRLLSPRDLIEGCLNDVIDEWSNELKTEDKLFLYIETLAHNSTRLLDFLYDQKVSLITLPECSVDLRLGGSFLEPGFWTSVRKKRFPTHDDAVNAYKDCLNSAVPEMWQQLFVWWLKRMEKCVDCRGDYVEQINYNLDLTGNDAASVMVNPNSVMPSNHAPVRPLTPTDNDNDNSNTTEQTSSTSTTINTASSSSSGGKTMNGAKRHFNFSPKLEPTEEADVVVQNGQHQIVVNGEVESDDYENDITESEEDDSEGDRRAAVQVTPQANGIKLMIPSNGNRPKATLLLPASSIKTLSPQLIKAQQQQGASALKVNNVASIRLQNFKILGQSNGNVQQLRRQIYNNNVQAQIVSQAQAQQQQILQQQYAAAAAAAAASSANSVRNKSEKDLEALGHDYDEKSYPKPAYSYSCLIAMALKNSQTGSLPVSEIYNFMCEHFPYFKTAPNGWKNSVRHNLSLNKCFEKIEKPAGNGNQRKGCLWAINPTKVAKMDEEVQKWSRKDPHAIKNAMIYPDHLELLERGEMKFIGCNSDLSEESSSDEVEGAAHMHQVAANSVTDSYDESSQDENDNGEQVYEEVEIDNKKQIHMKLKISKQDDCQDVPSAKRQKTVTSVVQANYIYQPASTARTREPTVTLVTTGAASSSFLKIE